MIRFLPGFVVVDRWAHSAQVRARRNARVGATRIAQRRAEHREVEEFLAARDAAPADQAAGS